MKLIALAKRAPVLVIATAVVLAYWPLATFGYTLTHGDTLDCWLPWRFFIAACLHNGELPLWNPMQQMGYPVHADLQGPAWYVEALALGGTIGHPVWVLQALFLGYLTLGGLGMCRLVRTLNGHAGAGLITGVAYALGGFFTGHTMHFYAVISAAWLPWLLEAQLRLMQAPHWRPALAAAVFQSFLLTGGNHTFNILVFYLVLMLFADRAWWCWRTDRHVFRALLRAELLFLGATVLMACGTLWSAVEVIPWMTRGEGLDLETASGGSFTWRAFVSLLFPFATGVDREALGTDPTMANGYMGVWVLVWAVLALFRRRSRVESLLLAFGAVCGLAALGPALPVHRLLWAWVPGMDLFRFPSYFLWGAQLAVLVLAGGTLARWEELMHRRALVMGVVGAALLVALALLLRAASGGDAAAEGAGLYERMRAMPVATRILLHGAVLVPVLIIGLGLVWRRRSALPWWCALVCVEMVWATGLAAWNTSIADLSPAAVQARIDAFPPGPVVPPMEPMRNAKDDASGLQVLWRNTQVYKGRPSMGGFNSFQLKHTVALLEGQAELRERLLDRPLAYLGDPQRDAVGDLGTLQLTDFRYTSMEAEVNAREATLLQVQQAWYPGWTAAVDGVAVPLRGVNIAGFALPVPAGVHQVRIAFVKPWVPVLLGVQLVVLFAALLLLARTSLASRAYLPLVLVLGGGTCWSLFAHTPRSERIQQGLWQLDSAGPPVQVVSTDRPALVRDHLPRARMVRCERSTDVDQLLRAFHAQEGPQVTLALAGPPLPPEGPPQLNEAGWHLMRRERLAGVELLHFVRQQPGEEGHVLHLDPLGGGMVLASPTSPYTHAYRQRIGDMDHAPGRKLCVDLKFTGRPGARGYVVIERKRGDRALDYEAVPFEVKAADSTWSSFMVLRDRRELRDPDAELGVYVWNETPDTLRVKDLRVRMVGGPRVKDGG